jgi:hypothetical protein
MTLIDGTVCAQCGGIHTPLCTYEAVAHGVVIATVVLHPDCKSGWTSALPAGAGKTEILREKLAAVEAMTLEQVQTELRAISGTPLRDDANRLRRRELWRRLDDQFAAASLNDQGVSNADAGVIHLQSNKDQSTEKTDMSDYNKRYWQDEDALWTDAFYDRDYEKDQTRRLAIFERVVEFLMSIGCDVGSTAYYDGTDIDPFYGRYISDITYKGTKYEHNPCYRVHYELPKDLIERLDAKFAGPEVTK